MTNEIVTIQPGELSFLFELKKQSSCSLQLVNNMDYDVAFKVKTTSPKKYCVRPNTGVIPPQSTCDVTVTMQAQKEAPPDMQCKDKFLVQSVMIPAGTTAKDITPEMFNKEPGKVYEEHKLRVVYVSPLQTTSPAPESLEEGSAPKDSVDNWSQSVSSLDNVVLKDPSELKTKLSEAMAAISNLMEEKNAVVRQKQQLQQEMATVRKMHHGRSKMGFSFLFVCFIGLVGIVVGYFFHS
jgi:hypothetical protein